MLKGCAPETGSGPDPQMGPHLSYGLPGLQMC